MSRDHLALMRHNLYLTSRTWGYRDFPRRAVRLISKDGAKKSPAACAIPMLRPVRIFLAVFAKATRVGAHFSSPKGSSEGALEPCQLTEKLKAVLVGL